MSGARLLANGVLYVVVTLIMDLYRSQGSLSVDGHDLLGRVAAGVVFAALFEALASVMPRVAGGGKRK